MRPARGSQRVAGTAVVAIGAMSSPRLPTRSGAFELDLDAPRVVSHIAKPDVVIIVRYVPPGDSKTCRVGCHG